MRYYDPTLGPFTQQDPTGQEATNVYAYAGNNPVNFTDPSGGALFGQLGAVVGTAIAVAGCVLLSIPTLSAGCGVAIAVGMGAGTIVSGVASGDESMGPFLSGIGTVVTGVIASAWLHCSDENSTCPVELAIAPSRGSPWRYQGCPPRRTA